jgi:hypothetical protein
VHEPKSLATALAQSFEKEMEGAPDNYETRSTPSIEGIRGVLKAIEDQTSSFDWGSLLLSVARKLELQDKDMYRSDSGLIDDYQYRPSALWLFADFL